MKIKILYSHLNVSGTDYKMRPSFFDFEKCFKNFLNTIPRNNPDLELHIVYDTARGGIDKNWIKDWKDIFKESKTIKFHEIQGGSMFSAAKEMYRISKELSEDMEDGDLFYFVENDYLHVDGWVDKVKDLFSCYNLDGAYVSTYDHPDKYNQQTYPGLQCQLFPTNTHFFRTTPSTCGTYIMNKKTFLEDYNILTTLEGDHNKFLHLSETKGRFVLSPIPSLSTHMMEGLLAPIIQWKEIQDKTS